MDYQNISLIGFMASGKSTIGRLLAKELGMLFIDIDRVIELKEDLPVFRIFDRYGEDYFRNIESEVIAKLYVNQNCVFACGGGVVERGENIRLIKKNSLVIYLEVSPQNVIARTRDSIKRPLLNVSGREEVVRNLLKKREPVYRGAADIILDTDSLVPEQAVEKIIGKLR
ncbi:MAG: shikimate kinase [Actinomycetota bacterium]